MYETSSKYCYPNSDVLINYLNIKDPKELENAERDLTSIRLAELNDRPIVGKWNLKHLQKIHKYIFQDVYPFAGKIRDEQIHKDGFPFANPLYIEQEAKKLFDELKSEGYLKGLKKGVMCERLAYYYSELNVLHPFREGNGRTQREFLRTLALRNGYTLDWTLVSREELLKASIQSTYNSKVMETIFEKTIQENEPNKALIKQWKVLENKLELD